MGLPGSGKTWLAERLMKLLDNCAWYNADVIRGAANDWDFSPEGRMRQANRMRYLSDGAVKAGKIVVTDFVAPTEAAREAFDPDFTVWMDTIDEGRFEDTNKMFVPPEKVDYHVSEWFEDTPSTLMLVVAAWMRNNPQLAFTLSAEK